MDEETSPYAASESMIHTMKEGTRRKLKADIEKVL